MSVAVSGIRTRILQQLCVITQHTLGKSAMASTNGSTSNMDTITKDSQSPDSPKQSPLLKRNYCRAMSGQSTAGIIVIGDEILKGQTLDTNSNFLCKKLFTLGVKVQKVSVICDEVDVIAQEVSSFSDKYTHVITSGGIGPTHDDMTFEGVAKAFDLKTEFNPELVQRITDWFKTTDMTSPEMKMAKIPETSQLRFGIDPKTNKPSVYPLVSVRNVYMFPGIPNLLEKAFTMLGDIFQNPDVKFHTDTLYIDKDEASVASIISDVASRYQDDDVVIGSYPNLTNSYYRVKVTIESTNPNKVQEAHKEMMEKMPEGSVVVYDLDPLQSAVQSIYSFMKNPNKDDPFIQCVQAAIRTIETALEKYGLDDICIGFNGGKDCTALLHLFYAVVKKETGHVKNEMMVMNYKEHQSVIQYKTKKYPDFNGKLKALYIRSRCRFPEVEKFVQLSRDRYNIEMLHYDGRIKECLETMVQDRPNIKAVIMGTRATDPYSAHLEEFSMTDSDWPQVMRVNPMLHWHYKHVWQFIRQLSLPYCSLYDRGYTSLGSMDNTHPNPLLQYVDKRGILTYKPAYLLESGEHERDGRNP